ncbi:MAG: nitroreductase [Kiritimatiellaeota bacterium]|nr:nitroreductase [Kiritimatiellota bacterium]
MSTTSPESAPPDCPGGSFLELAGKRRSCRAYDPEKPVPDAWIVQCLEAARRAPSACNRQPWRFVIVRDRDVRTALVDHGLLPGIRHGWLAAAPVIVALCAQRDWVTHRAAPLVSGIPYWLLDLGIAGEHFVLAATELGLGTCWIGWIRRRAVRRVLGLPRSIKPVSLIAVGFPALESAELPRRPRKELIDIVSGDRWGAPFRGQLQ